MYRFYTTLMRFAAPLLKLLLRLRQRKGKEDAARLPERMGQASLPRPNAPLIWIHAASVGEAQSALILIDEITKAQKSTEFLVTSGTVTSATLMAKRLPPHARHQYYPLDTPQWVERFLDHWRPDLALWMESELWPTMLYGIKARNIPAILVNARLSNRSYNRWKRFPKTAQDIVECFSLILAQTDEDSAHYQMLGAGNVIVTDNIKHAAAPLPCDARDLATLQAATQGRPLWLYASTHAGEEEITRDIHAHLKSQIPNLLSIIVPRHPERRDQISKVFDGTDLKVTLRGLNKAAPDKDTDIYIADTLGELGLFYRLAPVAVIGRSFSSDGGGGHNPIEAAQLDCAVLTGPNVQYQKQLFDEMLSSGAAEQLLSVQALEDKLTLLLTDPEALGQMMFKAQDYASSKNHIIENVMDNLTPYLEKSGQEEDKNAA